MRFTFLFSLLAVSVFGVAYWYVSTAGICPTPIYYRLGEVDERFGITEPEARDILARAEAVWEEALNGDLFIYREDTDFTVNFMYDERQKEASTEEEWRIELDAKEDKTKTAFAAVESLQVAYEEQRKEYELVHTRYETALASYNSEVEQINASGGATPEQFEDLEVQKTALNKERNTLLALEKKLTSAGEALNKEGESANNLVEAYNAEVARYNAVYGERSGTFTQGDYERERINVYTFSTKTELTKVLAHEFGHALGIGHVDGGDSLMYYLMADQPDELSLSAEDTSAFVAACGNNSNVTSKLRRTIRTALSYL